MSTRKQALGDRARRYGEARVGEPGSLCAMNGFEAGYRAALKDLRKVLKGKNQDEVMPTTMLLHRIVEFLRPIR